MKINSIQRRHERYRIIYICKILQGKVPNPGIKYDHNVVRGRVIIIPGIMSQSSTLAKRMREQSLTVQGGKLFNSLPVSLRNCTVSLEIFKQNLDIFLQQIPDRPITPSLTPSAMDQTSCKPSNSIIHWISSLRLTHRRPAL